MKRNYKRNEDKRQGTTINQQINSEMHLNNYNQLNKNNNKKRT